ncbi:Protein trichome birefringence-like 16 [Vitis vinifera]|uniref:Protein trichome birefringence-like 16 n=1 Tax=Vitis vinifera TaxID=29760 RepID=A0A438F657_VITVI|nr:Protein trichome birefringence-like 16 [Vitis vinifera]
MTVSISTVCNYAKGRWVADSRHPLYSGLGYNCEMPEFKGAAFLRKNVLEMFVAFVNAQIRMQDKTIAFIGDSLGRQQFQSLMCMVTGGEENLDVEDVGEEYGLVRTAGHYRPDGWAIGSQAPTAPFYTTGHHWNRGKLRANRWEMFVNGRPNEDRKIADMAFFRTISPRHFQNGEWNTGGSCDSITPLTGGSEVGEEESRDPVIANAVKGTKIKLLDITAISQLRDEAHISRYSIKATEGVWDCLHWCLPGIPDTWNELLVAQI